MHDETEAASPKGLEGAPEALRSAAPVEPSERRRWRPEELRGADLRGQDLRGVAGLLPEHLAGAVLTGATLPDDLAKFDALGQVAAISSEARKVFLGLLVGCVYSWLVIGTTKDVALILNTSSSPLPIINAPIPITGFYVIGATLLAAVYCYFHFYLQPLWRALATLPAVFRDGVAQDDKTDPWLLTNLVRTEFAQLRTTAAAAHAPGESALHRHGLVARAGHPDRALGALPPRPRHQRPDLARVPDRRHHLLRSPHVPARPRHAARGGAARREDAAGRFGRC